MLTRVFQVNEVEWPSKYVIGNNHGIFSNFEAAENYVKETYTPEYDRHMVIIATDMLDNWPTMLHEYNGMNDLTYYHQSAGEVVRD